jgi:hypothetical protein
MHLEDLNLLLKKVILVGGLWLTRTLLDHPHNRFLSTSSHSN